MSLAIPGAGELSTFQILRNGVYSFSKGFADSLRGAIELFFLDYKRAQQREQKLQQRDIDRELLLNRNSPVREIQNIAKRRALERREKERLRDASGGQKKSEPNIIERTVKCCLLNGGVFAVSIVLFDNIFLPLVRTILFIVLAGSQQRSLDRCGLSLSLTSSSVSELTQCGPTPSPSSPWHFQPSGSFLSSFSPRLLTPFGSRISLILHLGESPGL